MTDLKELFPVEVVEGTERPTAYFLVYQRVVEGENRRRFCIVKNKEPWSIPNTEDEVHADLEELFGDLTAHKTAWNRAEPYSLERAKSKIAASSRRGVGNVEFKNYLFYHGTEKVDRIATVIKNDVGYFIFANPKAENYIEKFNNETN